MIHNKSRNGNFTSSEIVALMSEPTAKAKTMGEIFGKPAITYIEECNWERKLGRSIEDKVSARPLTWGKLLEQRVAKLIGSDYIFSSDQTITHPTIPFWAGSKDSIKHDDGKTVTDTKCPITLKSFCQLVEPLYNGLQGIEAMNLVREKHKDGEKYYWQLVSNSILDNTKYAELIVYMPYLSELPEIKNMADGMVDCYWITMGLDDELPYLLDNGFYKNLNIIRFEVPAEDKKLLTERVIAAGRLLNGNHDQLPKIDVANIQLIKIKN